MTFCEYHFFAAGNFKLLIPYDLLIVSHSTFYIHESSNRINLSLTVNNFHSWIMNHPIGLIVSHYTIFIHELSFRINCLSQHTIFILELSNRINCLSQHILHSWIMNHPIGLIVSHSSQFSFMIHLPCTPAKVSHKRWILGNISRMHLSSVNKAADSWLENSFYTIFRISRNKTADSGLETWNGDISDPRNEHVSEAT